MGLLARSLDPVHKVQAQIAWRRPGEQEVERVLPAHARDADVRMRSNSEKRQRVRAREALALVLGGGPGGRAAWAHTRLEVVWCGQVGQGPLEYGS